MSPSRPVGKVPDKESGPRLAKREPTAPERIKRALALFQDLPDDALVEVRLVSALIGRSIASIWRDVGQGRLARPLRVGVRSTRWRAGDVRAAMRGEAGR